MTVILLIGLILVLLVIFLRNPINDAFGEGNKLVSGLQNAKWFQNHWLSGIFLFILNAVLFFSTVLILKGLMYLLIPFVHVIVMFMAVIASILSWFIINRAWQGTKRNRLIMAAIGSSFYIFTTLLFIYWYVTLKPAFPGDDLFMAAIGLTFSIIVTVVACITCFIITGFSRIKVVN